MAAFPTLDRLPGATGFAESIESNAIDQASAASGLPVLNKLFTFAPETWNYVLHLVSQANKNAIKAHYLANCDVPFDWTNEQDDVTYEVIYDGPPDYKLDRLKTLWQITLKFKQYSPN